MFKLAISYITKMKKNTIICLSGIVVSVIMIFSLVQISITIKNSFNNVMLSNSNYDLMIDKLDYKTMSEIYDNYKEKYNMTQVNFFAVYNENYKLNEVIGVRGEWQKTFKVELKQGNMPLDDDIVIEESYAKEHNISIGDKVNINLTGDYESLMAEFNVSGIISDTPSYTSGSYMFVSMDSCKKILEENRLYEDNEDNYTVYFMINEYDYPEEDITQIYQYIYDKYGKEIIKNINQNTVKYELFYNEKDVYGGMRTAIKGIIIFITLTMVIYIYYMMFINIQSKYKHYGILRAIGARLDVVSRLILYELIIYGVLGVVFGCLGGAIFNKIFGKTIIDLLMENKINNISVVSVSMILYVIMLVAAAIIMVWIIFVFQMRRKNPIEMMQQKAVYNEKKQFVSSNIYMDLIVNNCFRNKKNTKALMLTIVLSSIMTIGFINGCFSVSFDVDKSIFAFSDCEIAVIPGAYEEMIFSKEQIKMFESKSDEIYKQSVPGFIYNIEISDNTGKFSDCGIVIYSRNLMEQLTKINHLKKATKVVSCGDKLEKSHNYNVNIDGKKSTISVDEKLEEGWSVLLGDRAGNYENILIIDEDYAKDKFEFDCEWNDILLKGITREEINNIVNTEEYEIFDLNKVMGQANSQIRSIMVLVLYMICSVVFLTVFLIRTIIKESFEHRKKEIGMMIAIGTRKYQTILILLGEVLLLILLSEIISAVLSIPLSIYMYAIMNEKMGMAWEGFVIGIPLIVILSSIAIFVNVKMCMKEKVTSLLKCEG